MSTTQLLVIDTTPVRVTTNARLPRVLTWLRLAPRRLNDAAMRLVGKTPLPEHLRPSRTIRAVTIGAHIRCAMDGSDVTAALLAHEMCHVLQRARLGFWEYYRRYVVDLLRDGYDLDHDLEREAHDYARDHAGEYTRYLALLPRHDDPQRRAAA